MKPDVTNLIDAAEHAAAAGEYASAEALLREAVGRQEADLGPVHPDLANTLNNLAVLCDITNKVAEAERLYRRAHALATATLEPAHPCVATSRKNLIDFCEARGISVGAAARPPAVKVAIGAVVACGLVLALYVAARPWFSSNVRAGAIPDIAITTPAAPPTPTPEPVERTPPAREAARGRTEPAGEVSNRADTTASASAEPVVATAQLCKTLSTDSGTSTRVWRCDPPGDPVEPGSLVFYTRVKSDRSTTIQHRWYRGDELRRVVELRVGASPTEGYRTFSRNAVDRQSDGDWKVEVRTKDGVLLHEERFVVR